MSANLIAVLALECAQAQGYGIARPMPAEALPSWLADWPKRRDWAALFIHGTTPGVAALS